MNTIILDSGNNMKENILINFLKDNICIGDKKISRTILYLYPILVWESIRLN